MARGKFGFSTERMRRIFRENWSFFFRYQRRIHKEFLFADRFDGEPECKYYESDRSCRGYWRYDLQKQGMELRALRNPEHEYIRILGVSTCIAELQSVYQDELFFKVKKKSSDYLFLTLILLVFHYLHSGSLPKRSAKILILCASLIVKEND